MLKTTLLLLFFSLSTFWLHGVALAMTIEQTVDQIIGQSLELPQAKPVLSGYSNYRYRASVNTDARIDVEESFDYVAPFGATSSQYAISYFIQTSKSDSLFQAEVRNSMLTRLNDTTEFFVTDDKKAKKITITWHHKANQAKQTVRIAYTLENAISFLLAEDMLYIPIIGPVDTYHYGDISPLDGTVRIELVFPKAIAIATVDKTLHYFVVPVAEPLFSQEVDTHNNMVAYELSQTERFIGFSNLFLSARWTAGAISRTQELLNTGKFVWYERLLPHAGYIASLFLVALLLLTPLFSESYRRFLWFYAKIKKAVVPEYEPPLLMPPAMIDVLLHGRTTGRTWPATIADLASRGAVELTKSARTPRNQDVALGPYWESLNIEAWVFAFVANFALCTLEAFVLFFSVSFFPSATLFAGAVLIQGGGTLILLQAVLLFYLYRFFQSRRATRNHFVLHRVESFPKQTLRPFERALIEVIFGTRTTVPVRSLLLPGSAYVLDVSGFFQKNEKIEALLYQELADIRVANQTMYAKTPSTSRQKAGMAILTLFVYEFLILMIMTASQNISQGVLLRTTFASVVCVVLAMLLLHPRLSQLGVTTQRNIKGFRFFLEIAEKYRLGKLPDTKRGERVERYLPYAMLFGIEKKWSRSLAFSTIQIEPWDEGWSLSWIIWKLIFYIYYPFRFPVRLFSRLFSFLGV